MGLPPNLLAGETNPTPSTLQFKASRLAGLPLVVPDAAAALLTDGEVPVGTLVTIQEYETGGLKAVVGPVADTDDEYNTGTILMYGFIEQSLQSEGRGSIAPSSNVFKAGDRVAVVTNPNEVYAVPYDTDHTPTHGIATAYFTKAGKLTSVSGGGNVAAAGAVFTGVSGLQLSNQLKSGYMFYRKASPVTP